MLTMLQAVLSQLLRLSRFRNVFSFLITPLVDSIVSRWPIQKGHKPAFVAIDTLIFEVAEVGENMGI